MYLLCSHDDPIGLNFTNTFLVFTEEDIGDLLKIRLSWEGDSESLSSVFKYIKNSFWNWNAKAAKPVLEVRRIRYQCKKWGLQMTNAQSPWGAPVLVREKHNLLFTSALSLDLLVHWGRRLQ
ncbi:hypothetical protein GOODEAATRI_001740, partial [Goodea atripinnis]